jgi:hypothetical protein
VSNAEHAASDASAEDAAALPAQPATPFNRSILNGQLLTLRRRRRRRQTVAAVVEHAASIDSRFYCLQSVLLLRLLRLLLALFVELLVSLRLASQKRLHVTHL